MERNQEGIKLYSGKTENYDRVTEVIAAFSGIDKVPNDVLQRAADRGTLVHKTIESLLMGWGEHLIDPSILPYIESFRYYWLANQHVYKHIEPILEKRLYCDKLKITGQIDLILTSGSRTYLVDWKTSSAFHKSWYLQGAAYKHLCVVNGYADPDEVVFVRLKKDGKMPALHKSNDHETHFKLFKECLNLYRFFGMQNKRNKE